MRRSYSGQYFRLSRGEPEFDSPSSRQGPIAQLDRAADYESVRSGFESSWDRHFRVKLVWKSPGLGSRRPEVGTPHPDQFDPRSSNGKSPDFESVKWGFESLAGNHCQFF